MHYSDYEFDDRMPFIVIDNEGMVFADFETMMSAEKKGEKIARFIGEEVGIYTLQDGKINFGVPDVVLLPHFN